MMMHAFPLEISPRIGESTITKSERERKMGTTRKTKGTKARKRDRNLENLDKMEIL